MDNSFIEIIEKLSNNLSNRETSLCIGTFDGVHKGHQKLFDELSKVSKKRNFLSLVFVFENRPRETINKDSSRPYLLTLEDRINKIKSKNIDKIIKINFDEEIRNLSAKEFLKILREKINLKCLVVSKNTKIGKDQKSHKILEEICLKLEIEFYSINMTSNIESLISSSNISDLIKKGEMEKANSMLGQDFYLIGNVEEGDKLGRTIGFPTANLNVKKTIQLPVDGIYASLVEIDNQIYYGALSIGTRPVIKKDDSRKIEVYIIDFNKNIYGKDLKVSVISKIRSQTKYNSLEELKIQIEKDVAQIKKYLNNGQ